MLTLLDRVFPAQKASVKAVTGPGFRTSSYYPMLDQLQSMSRDPQKAMREAQSVYHTHPWVRACENVIGHRFATVSWHLEDDQGEEVTDKSPEAYRIVQRLIERPYTPKPGDPVSSTPRTRAQLWKIISRHLGLCNVAPLFLDQLDATAQTPLQLLYINPARLYPVTDNNANLTGWVLDRDDRGGGMPLELAEVLLIVLDPPDVGFFGSGLVEAASSKLELTRLADRQAAGVLGTGGRLPGVFAPKGEQTLSDEQFEQLKRDVRAVNESVDAAKRSLVLRGPVEFTRTSATSSELNLVEIANMGRDDTCAEWGVPLTQLGIALPAGLNSGGAKDVDFEVLWQNAVGPRLRTFRESFQFELLDRFKQLGIAPELVIEEPTFDDDAPLYEKAQKALDQPLTNIERRNLLGLDPFGDDRDDEVWLPMGLVKVYPVEEPRPVPPALAPFAGVDNPPAEETAEPIPQEEPPEGKARVLPSLVKLREKVEKRMHADLTATLAKMQRDVSQRMEEHGAHVMKKPTDLSAVFDAKYWDAELERVLRPHVQIIASASDQRIKTALGKASLRETLPSLLKKVGLRVKGINDYTRERISALVREGIEQGMSPARLAVTLRDAPMFNELRAETIARTETGYVLNQAALNSYGSYGVEKVQAYDGDDDEVCAARNGQIYSIEEAESIEDHPNGTLDWAPIVGAI